MHKGKTTSMLTCDEHRVHLGVHALPAWQPSYTTASEPAACCFFTCCCCLLLMRLHCSLVKRASRARANRNLQWQPPPRAAAQPSKAHHESWE